MIIRSEQEMLDFGRNFAENLIQTGKPAKSTVLELIGDVGAGKTTFVRGLASGLGIKEAITSPSFTISKTYALPKGGRLVHYDFYRLDNPGIMSEDLQDTLNDPDNIIVIEWGKSISDLLPVSHIIINIQYNDDETRTISILQYHN